ncbi:glycoside hydrolase family 25 protein [Shinella daejeonensis]|uniref:glycoside hydrolase family 25 protein n=1 Tax=Shinella daejeonensis TaxID=659017 RepID=UPI0020C74B5D|nr:glycoside hydrolase family 25 protein [Shinella daejeonensis]MCP8893839.1 glycoside hydrolase family 25 protein [Shinella daejeonensis]
MRRLLLALLPCALLAAACSTTDYDVLSTVSPSRFDDRDPHDFGTRSPHGHPVHGIDVSKWNGDIDWPKVRQSGVAFAFLKATEGSDRVDSRFSQYWRGAKAAGLPHAPYHFYYFCSTADAQADWFIANVPKEAVRMPPVLDAEWNPASPTCRIRPAAEDVRAALARFLERLEKHYGKRPIIYTTVDFHRDNLVGHFETHPFWLRSVANHPGAIYPARRWAFWQYTSTGVVPGIAGDTDINVFAGSASRWKQWLAEVSR